jgi:hypothetical protein
MATAKLFEKAVRAKLRFITERGVVSLEDLWDLPLSALNDLAKNTNREVKASEEEDFLKTATAKDKSLALQFEVLLYVLKTKVEERDAKIASVAKAEQKAKLVNALARKQDASMEAMSEEEIQAAIAEL